MALGSVVSRLWLLARRTALIFTVLFLVVFLLLYVVMDAGLLASLLVTVLVSGSLAWIAAHVAFWPVYLEMNRQRDRDEAMGRRELGDAHRQSRRRRR
jgi:uncharacterized membrane protein YagU involved in acid resistance